MYPPNASVYPHPRAADDPRYKRLAKRWEARRIRTYNASTLPCRGLRLRVVPAPSSDQSQQRDRASVVAIIVCAERPADPAGMGSFYAIC